MNEKRPEVSEFDSVDPAPPSTVNDVTRLRATLCDEEEDVSENEGLIRTQEYWWK